MPYQTLDKKPLAKAVRLNPQYAYTVGWIKDYPLVCAIIGMSDFAPTMEAFSNAVYGWQLQQMWLKADGILGQKTWEAMRFAPIPESITPFPPPPSLTDHPAKAVTTKKTPGGRINSGMWFGLSVDLGAFAGAAGRNAVSAQMYSCDDPGRQFMLTSDRVRIGVGAGGGLGVSLCIIVNVFDPKQLQGFRTGGYDFSFAIGGKWGALIKGSVKMARFARLMSKLDELKAAGKLGKGAYEMARSVGKLEPDEYAMIAKLVKECLDPNGSVYTDLVKDPKQPGIVSLSLPLPGAMEVSAYYQDDLYTVHANH